MKEKLIRVNDSTHKALTGLVRYLEYDDIDSIIVEMISCYRAKVKGKQYEVDTHGR